MTVTQTRKLQQGDASSSLRFVQINVPFNFKGSKTVQNPLAPAVHLHYYQVIPGAVFPPLPVRVPTPEPPGTEADELVYRNETFLFQNHIQNGSSYENQTLDSAGSDVRPNAEPRVHDSLGVSNEVSDIITKEENYLRALDTLPEEISEWNPFGSPHMESDNKSELELEPKSVAEQESKPNVTTVLMPKLNLEPQSKSELEAQPDGDKNSKQTSENVQTDSKVVNAKPSTEISTQAGAEEGDSEKDDEKMALERKRLMARMNKRRARRKKNKKTKGKNIEAKPAKGKKDPSPTKTDQQTKQPGRRMATQSRTAAAAQKGGVSQLSLAGMDSSSGSMQTLSPPTNLFPQTSNPRTSQVNMLLEQMQMLQRLMAESNQNGKDDSKEQGLPFSPNQLIDPNLLQAMMMSGVKQHNRALSNMELVSESQLGRIKEEATSTKRSSTNGRKSKAKKRQRERIKSFSGQMIPLNLATREELGDKLSIVVYFHGLKAKSQCPLTIIVGKDWDFKKCMRKAIAEMQKRPETTQCEDLRWILQYDVNSTEGVKAIRQDLRVLMGDRRIEHRGSHLNHKPADYTDSFTNKLWIVPNKGVDLNKRKSSKITRKLPTNSSNSQKPPRYSRSSVRSNHKYV